MAAVDHVNPGGLGQTQEVHAAVLKEAPVFDGQHRIHHQLRDLVVRNQLPLGPVLGIEQGGDHLRFEFVGRQIARFAGDAFDFAAPDTDDGRFRAVIGIGAGLDLDAAFKQAVTAHGRFAALVGIAGAAQLGRNLFGFDLFAHLDGPGDGINSGRVAEHRTLEALVDHSAKLDVVVGEERPTHSGQDEENHQRRAQQRILEGPTPSGFASLPACRDLESYGHNEMSGGASTVLDDGAHTYRYPVTRKSLSRPDGALRVLD